MKITEYREAIRQDFLDLPNMPNFVFKDESIDRAIRSAIEDFSRWVPNELYAEIVSDSSAKTQTFLSTGITTLSKVQLSQVPVRRPLTITRTGPDVTYTENTDYFVDYLTGIITFPTGSAIIALADGITLTITYYLSRSIFNVSALRNFRSINSINVYSGSHEYGSDYNFNLLGNYLHLNDTGEIPNGYRLALTYEARHTPPDENADGTVPDAFAEVIIKGAEAQLLFGLAISLEIAQTDNFNDLSDLDDLFDSITDDIASGRASLALANAQVLSAITYIDAASVAGNGDIVSLQSSLTTALTYIQNAFTQLAAGATKVDVEVETLISAAAARAASSDSNLVAGLAKIDVEVEAKITAASNKSTTADSHVTTGEALATPALAFIDTEVGTDLTDAKTKATITAQGYLDLGDDFINDVNTGQAPDDMYQKYAQVAAALAEQITGVAGTRIALAKEYVEIWDEYLKGAQTRIAQVEQFIEEGKLQLTLGDEYVKAASGYINATQATNQLAQTTIELGNFYNNNAQGYLEAAKSLADHAQAHLGILRARVEYVQVYLAKAEGYITVASGYQKSAELAAMSINAGITRATEIRNSGSFIVDLADRIRREASRRYEDFKMILADRTQMRRVGATISPKQSR